MNVERIGIQQIGERFDVVWHVCVRRHFAAVVSIQIVFSWFGVGSNSVSEWRPYQCSRAPSGVAYRALPFGRNPRFSQSRGLIERDLCCRVGPFAASAATRRRRERQSMICAIQSTGQATRRHDRADRAGTSTRGFYRVAPAGVAAPSSRSMSRP
jgi:hypothetical protein